MRRGDRQAVTGMVLVVLMSCLPGRVMAQDRRSVLPSTDVIFENEYVRVQWHDVDIGETILMHSHPPAVIIAFGNASARFAFPSGGSRMAQAVDGGVYWNDAASDEVTNVGNTVVHNLMVELKATPLDIAPGGSWSLDLLPLAAAPLQHKVLLENPNVRVLEVTSLPGSIAPAHVHEWHSVFITVSPARLLFRDSAGEIVYEVSGKTPGEGLPRVEWFGPSMGARSVENADTVPLKAYRIELKSNPGD